VSGAGFDDVLYDGIPCLGGPPEGCDSTNGTPVAVVEGSITRFVDFALERQLPHADGFESGTSSAWSLTVP
jgi:hypothetical protein